MLIAFIPESGKYSFIDVGYKIFFLPGTDFSWAVIIMIIIIMMSIFNEDNIFSKYTNLTYGPLKSKNTNLT